MRCALSVLALAFATIFAASGARAQSGPPPGGRGGAEAEPQTRAYELFRRSEGEYRAGRFAAAAALLEEAYRLDPAPVLLYNLARAYEGMGELERAIDAYGRYLHDEPRARDRGAIEVRLDTLSRQLEERRALDRLRQQREQRQRSGTLRARTGGPAAGRARRPGGGAGPGRIFPWVVAGVGVAGVATGLVLGAMASARHDDAVAEPGFLPATELQDEAESLATVANVLFVAGGVVVAAGVTWGVLGLVAASDEPARDRARARARVSVAPERGGALVVVSTPIP